MLEVVSRGDRDQVLAQIANEMAELQLAVDGTDQALADHLGVNRTDRRCLDLLVRRGPMTPTRIGQNLALTPGSVTTMVDRLERAGYLSRTRHPDSGRQVLVTVTDRLNRIVAELFADRATTAAAELAGYRLEELTVIRDFLLRTRDRQTAFAARLRALPTRTTGETKGASGGRAGG
jgi:DNA-binding MarR family transcriptional regulator